MRAGQQAAPAFDTGAARATGPGNDRSAVTLADIRAAQEAITCAVRTDSVNAITEALEAAERLGVTPGEIRAATRRGRAFRERDRTRRLEEAEQRGTLR